MKYPRENISDSQNIHQKKKKMGPTKYPRENHLDPRNTQGKKIGTLESMMARWHETHET